MISVLLVKNVNAVAVATFVVTVIIELMRMIIVPIVITVQAVVVAKRIQLCIVALCRLKFMQRMV
jgi:hypothetical protein